MSDLEAVNPYQAGDFVSSDAKSTFVPVTIAAGSFIVAAVIILGSIWLGWWSSIATDPLSISISEGVLLSSTGSVALAFTGVGIGVLRRLQRLTLVCPGLRR